MATIIRHSARYLEDGYSPAEIIDFAGTLGEWILSEYKGKQIPFAVYRDVVSTETLVDLKPENAENLMALDGVFVVVETAGDPVSIGVSVALTVILSVALIKLQPKPKLPDSISRQQESPNNRLAGRSNEARPFQRLPDIKGTVKSFPDIMMPSYRMYEVGQEVELAAYVFGRKELDFNYFETVEDGVTVYIPDVRDGDTPIHLIDGGAAKIYLPGDNISSPSHTIGDSFDDSIYTPHRVNEVNGITLESFGEFEITSETDVYGNKNSSGGYIRRTNGAGYWDDTVFISGQKFVLTNYVVVKDGNDYDISGTYVIAGFNESRSRMYFTESVPFGGTGAPYLGYTITPENGETSTRWTDFFYMTADKVDYLLLNVVAPNGLYKDTGAKDLVSVEVGFEFEIIRVDEQGEESGSSELIAGTISGNSQKRIGTSIFLPMSSIGSGWGKTRFKVKARRTTPTEFGADFRLVDEVKFDDCYGLLKYGGTDFGDITWIHTRTKATESATSIKDRKLNAIVHEVLEPYLTPTTQGAKGKNNNAIQSLIASALDDKEGRLTTSEIDIAGLLQIESDIQAYFSSGSNNLEFSFTFDSTDTTWQDMCAIMLDAINCIGYRENGKVTAYFERSQLAPAMLFTNRSKLPGEKYTRKFNDDSVADGIDFKWINPETNLQESIIESVSGGSNPTRPAVFNIAGIRNQIQAITRKNRELNKIKFQKIYMEFTATAEGRYVRIGEMISVVKGTRTHTYDGEIIAVSGLEITLSQDVDVTTGTWYIQIKDETGAIETRTVTSGGASNKVVLSSLPVAAIRTGIDSRRTEFTIGKEEDLARFYWLPQSVDISDPFTAKITAINYSDEYYADDDAIYSGFDLGFDSGFS